MVFIGSLSWTDIGKGPATFRRSCWPLCPSLGLSLRWHHTVWGATSDNDTGWTGNTRPWICRVADHQWVVWWQRQACVCPIGQPCTAYLGFSLVGLSSVQSSRHSLRRRYYPSWLLCGSRDYGTWMTLSLSWPMSAVPQASSKASWVMPPSGGVWWRHPCSFAELGVADLTGI